MPNKLPDKFDSSKKSYSLYEDIDYKEYWTDPGQHRQDSLERFLIDKLLPKSGRRLIDLGCGYGRLAPCYLNKFDQVVLYDGSISLLKQAYKNINGQALIIAGDIKKLPFKKASFDCILTIRVLQHVHELLSVLKEMRRVLAASGNIVFSYHNKRNAHRVLHWFLSGKITNPFTQDSVEVSPTLLSHHPSVVSRLLREADLSNPVYRGAVVINTLAKITEKLTRPKPAGTAWSYISGRYKLAPWLIGISKAKGGETLMPSSSLYDFLCCPACNKSIMKESDSFECSGCHRRFPILEGIIDLRL